MSRPRLLAAALLTAALSTAVLSATAAPLLLTPGGDRNSFGASISANGLSLACASSGNFGGLNPSRRPQIWLQSLAPTTTAAVSLPASLPLALLALGSMWLTSPMSLRRKARL